RDWLVPAGGRQERGRTARLAEKGITLASPGREDGGRPPGRPPGRGGLVPVPRRGPPPGGADPPAPRARPGWEGDPRAVRRTGQRGAIRERVPLREVAEEALVGRLLRGIRERDHEEVARAGGGDVEKTLPLAREDGGLALPHEIESFRVESGLLRSLLPALEAEGDPPRSPIDQEALVRVPPA